MDIWRWIQELEEDLRQKGNIALADAIDQLPELTCADHHEKVDQIYPEALSLAKKESNPWLEVFVRHWYLQSQVLHRHNVAGMVSEAVDLLEFSSRDNTKDCPQSICVVQDLANCYAKKDGPAYIKERIDVSTETLNRINPRWPCFDCIASEQIDALVDAQEYQQALDKIDFYRGEMAKVSSDYEKTPFALIESKIYRQLGEYEKAEKLARKSRSPYSGESFLRYRTMAIALALGYQEKFSEAQEHVLEFSEAMLSHSHYLSWCEYYYLKAKHGRICY